MNNDWISRAFHAYVRREARIHFAGLHWSRPASGATDTRPILFVANHTNWWDGFFAWLVTAALGLRFRVLMEAEQLARYPFFRRVGALPMERRVARQAYRDLMAGRDALTSGTALWVFPQGRRRPAAEPITRLERGAALLALDVTEPVRIIPVAFRYVYRGEQLPEGFARLGPERVLRPGEVRDRRALTEQIGRRLADTVAQLDRALLGEDLTGFVPLVPGRLSINKRLDRIRHRLGLLRGEFDPRNG